MSNLSRNLKANVRRTNSERIRNARTPDRLQSGTLDCTTTTNSPRRKTAGSKSKLGAMPSHMTQSNPNLYCKAPSSNSNLRKLELENNNLELELCYSEYLRSAGELILEEKRLKETEVAAESEVKAIQEETKSLIHLCHNLQARITDVKFLSHFCNVAEEEIKVTGEFLESFKKYEIPTILQNLNNLLQKFDVLRCENIVIPPEDFEEMEGILNKCDNNLNEIANPGKCKTLENMKKEYDDFIKNCKEALDLNKILDDKIEKLQIEALKTTALLD